MYYDLSKIMEDKLLEFLRQRRCPRAALDRPPGETLTAMNPFVGPGGIVQLQFATPETGQSLSVKLLDKWTIVGPATGTAGDDGKTYLSIQVPDQAKPASHTLTVTSSGKNATTTVEVVRQVGK